MKMTKAIKFLSLSLILGIVLSSCSTSNDVASNGGIQKRKYNKGFYFEPFSSNKKDHKNIETSDESLAVKEEVKESLKEAKDLGAEKGFVYSDNLKQLDSKEELAFEYQKHIDTDENISAENNDGLTFNTASEQRNPLIFSPVRAEKHINKGVNVPAPASGGAMLIVLVILALLIPPLAVFIYEGASTRFWIDLILALIGIGLGWWLFGPSLAWLCAVVAVIYALLIVLEVI